MMQKQLNCSALINAGVNANGVQYYIDRNGVLLTYALDASDDIELYFPDLQSALYNLQLPNIQSVTPFHLTTLYFMS